MITSASPSLVVYGATGVTGSLVCHELCRRQQPFIAAARNHQKLRELVAQLKRAYGVNVPWRVASPNMPSTLDAMLEGARVLISCAGPFSDVGAPIARAAIRKHVHYLDTTGEQGYIQWLSQELHELAAARSLILAPASAYEYALGDLGCAIAASLGHRHLLVCYASRGGQTSQGTKKSIWRAASAPGLTFARGQLQSQPTGYRAYSLEFPDGVTRRAFWIPGGEPLMVPRHHPQVLTVETCAPISAKLADLMPTLSPFLPRLASALGDIADKVIDQATEATLQQEQGQVPFDVLICDPDSGKLLLSIAGQDPYLVTARIVVEAAQRLGAPSYEPANTGFTSLAALFEPRAFLSAIDLKLSARATS